MYVLDVPCCILQCMIVYGCDVMWWKRVHAVCCVPWSHFFCVLVRRLSRYKERERRVLVMMSWSNRTQYELSIHVMSRDENSNSQTGSQIQTSNIYQIQNILVKGNYWYAVSNPYHLIFLYILIYTYIDTADSWIQCTRQGYNLQQKERKCHYCFYWWNISKSVLLLDSRSCREVDERRSMRKYKYYAYIVSNLQ